MTPIFSINTHSLEIGTFTITSIDTYLDELMKSFLYIYKQIKQKYKSVYLYSENVKSEGVYNFSEYKKNLARRNRDLAFFINKVQDRTPYYNFIEDKEFMEIANSTLTINSVSYNADIIYFTYLKDGCLLSVPNNKIWAKNELSILINNILVSTVSNIYKNDKIYLDSLIKSILNLSGKHQLEDKNRFVFTGKLYKSAKIYKEIKTGYYWYYDNFHDQNGQPHFEVFRNKNEFLGEYDMNMIKIPNSEYDKENRVLPL